MCCWLLFFFLLLFASHLFDFDDDHGYDWSCLLPHTGAAIQSFKHSATQYWSNVNSLIAFFRVCVFNELFILILFFYFYFGVRSHCFEFGILPSIECKINCLPFKSFEPTPQEWFQFDFLFAYFSLLLLFSSLCQRFFLQFIMVASIYWGCFQIYIAWPVLKVTKLRNCM